MNVHARGIGIVSFMLTPLGPQHVLSSAGRTRLNPQYFRIRRQGMEAYG
jgi:hypothetical protein